MMDCLTHRPDVNIFLQEPITDLLVNFGVFEWLYFLYYRPDKHFREPFFDYVGLAFFIQ